MTTIMEMPKELILAFVADPLCQLRYTCKRFRREISPAAFTLDGRLVSSGWYSARVPMLGTRSVLNAADGREYSWGEIAHAAAPYLFVKLCESACMIGLQVWDREQLRYLSAAPNYRAYKLYDTTHAHADVDPVELIPPDAFPCLNEFVVISRLPFYIVGCYKFVAHVGAATLGEFVAAGYRCIVYKRMKLAEFY